MGGLFSKRKKYPYTSAYYPPYGYNDPYNYYDPYGYRDPYGYPNSLTEAFGGMSPMSYGNYYMGNTTLQMMPFMQRKVAKFQQLLGSSFGGGITPVMPALPCMPACSSIPMVTAVASLPMASYPLVQSMYPMVPTSTANWFNPSSFGSFCPQFNSMGSVSCCCNVCVPSAPVPAVSYYPRPVCVPQPVPVACPTPVAIPNIQQVPVPRPVPVVAPPIVAGASASCVPAGTPLLPSQGCLVQGAIGQPLVMASKCDSTVKSLVTNEECSDSTCRRPFRKVDQARRNKAQRIAASLSKLGLDSSIQNKAVSKRKMHRHPSTRHSHLLDSLSSLSFPDEDNEIHALLSKAKGKQHNRSSSYRR